jgi:hypothetical protein
MLINIIIIVYNAKLASGTIVEEPIFNEANKEAYEIAINIVEWESGTYTNGREYFTWRNKAKNQRGSKSSTIEAAAKLLVKKKNWRSIAKLKKIYN